MNYEKRTFFHSYAKWWVDTFKKKEIKKGTYRKYSMGIDFIKKNFPDLRNEEITPKNWQKVIDEYSKTRSETTIKDFNNLFRQAIYDLLNEKTIEKDPYYRLRITPGVNHVSEKERFLSMHEAKKLVRALDLSVNPNSNRETRINTRNYLIFIMLKTGVRYGEAIGLTPNDFDFKNNTLNIDKQWDYKMYEGFVGLKSKTSYRKVPLDEETSEIFKKYLKEIKVQNGVPFFVYMSKGSLPNSIINEHLKKVCKKADVPVVNAHSLRHTFASLCVANGVSLQQTSEWLGHSSTVVTQRVYTHITDELEQEDTEIINKVMVNL